MTSTSTWFALKNPVFLRLWLASVLSGTFVSAQDIAATWLMYYLVAPLFSLSLLTTAASAPFFLFTLPAGAVADIANRPHGDRDCRPRAGRLLRSAGGGSLDWRDRVDAGACLYFPARIGGRVLCSRLGCDCPRYRQQG